MAYSDMLLCLRFFRWDVWLKETSQQGSRTHGEVYDVPDKGRFYQLLNTAFKKIAACTKT